MIFSKLLDKIKALFIQPRRTFNVHLFGISNNSHFKMQEGDVLQIIHDDKVCMKYNVPKTPFKISLERNMQNDLTDIIIMIANRKNEMKYQ